MSLKFYLHTFYLSPVSSIPNRSTFVHTFCWDINKEEMHERVTEIKLFEFAVDPLLNPSLIVQS